MAARWSCTRPLEAPSVRWYESNGTVIPVGQSVGNVFEPHCSNGSAKTGLGKVSYWLSLGDAVHAREGCAGKMWWRTW